MTEAVQVIDYPAWASKHRDVLYFARELDECDVTNRIKPEQEQDIFDIGRDFLGRAIGFLEDPIVIIDISRRKKLPEIRESRPNQANREVAEIEALRTRFEVSDYDKRFNLHRGVAFSGATGPLCSNSLPCRRELRLLHRRTSLVNLL
jgi:hypothetical protein